MFSIFIDESGTGKIRSGKWSESFSVNIDQIRSNQIGEMIWRDEIQKFVAEHKRVCILYTEKGPPTKSNFWKGWIIFRSGGNIFITEQIFMFSFMLKMATILRMFDAGALEKRFLLMVERESPFEPDISKWPADEDEIKKFLEF